MDRSQWISLAFIGLLIVVDIFILSPAFPPEAESGDRSFPGEHAGHLLALIGVASIWWPDVVGAVLLFARFGPLPDSWTPAVRCLGWLLLLLVVVIRIQCIRQVL